jgi:hypothetical protein
MKRQLLLALALIIAAAPLYAQVGSTKIRDENGEIKYSVEESYMTAASKANLLSTATNVVLKEVTYSVLPDFLQQQAQMLAKDCVGNIDATSSVKYYRYTSDFTRDKGYSPNYIFDFAAWAKLSQKSCIIGHACSDKECMFVGYKASGTDTWGQNFVVKNTSWLQKEIPSPGKDAKPTDKLFLFSVNAQRFCPPREDGKAAPTPQTANCVSDQIWQETGLQAYVAPPVLDEPAPTASPVPLTGGEAAPADAVPAEAPAETAPAAQ